MSDYSPINPPEELLEHWRVVGTFGNWQNALTLAYRAGADQELEACCEWFVRDWTDIETADKLRDARRPKPPSLKDQALVALMALEIDEPGYEGTYNTIRRALEALPND